MGDDTRRLPEERCCACRLGRALPSFDPERASASEVSEDLRDNLKRSDAVLLVYERGPVTQVRQFITEFRKSKAEDGARPGRIAVCQPDPDPMALGITAPDLEVFVTGGACSESCARQFLEAFKR